MKKFLLLLFTFWIGTVLHARAPFDYYLTFYIRQYPSAEEVSLAKIEKTLHSMGKIPSKIMRSFAQQTNDGIFSSYSGYLIPSSFTGEIRFPRFHQKPSFQWLITESIKPIMMVGNTIHHWELDPKKPAVLYSVERKEDDETKLSYWEVQKKPLPQNKIITTNTIVIFSKPKYIFVPTGISLTTDNPQLLLPPIYAKKNINRVLPALDILKIRQFFGPLPIKIKKENDTYYVQQRVSSFE